MDEKQAGAPQAVGARANEGRGVARIEAMVPRAALEALRPQLRGGVCFPGEPGYDQARTLWNAMIDRHPAAVIRAAGAADVKHAVRLASENGLLLAVRGGGHNIAGNGSCEGGLLLDSRR